jgi:hypothetical protein
MAYEFSNYAVKATFVAGEDLSTKQYHFVKLEPSTGDVILVAAATDRPLGVLQNNPTDQQEAEVLMVGGTKIAGGGTAAVGTPLFANATGKAVTLAFGTTGATAYAVGTFITAGVSGATSTAAIACVNAGRGQ